MSNEKYGEVMDDVKRMMKSAGLNVPDSPARPKFHAGMSQAERDSQFLKSLLPVTKLEELGKLGLVESRSSSSGTPPEQSKADKKAKLA